METTGKAFVEFWDWTIEKGLMKANTARSFGSAARRVLSVDEDWESTDVSTLDVDGLLQRFRNLRGKDYTPRTLAAYERRFRRALDLFMEYNRDPASWKPPTRQARPKRESESKSHPQSPAPKQSDVFIDAAGAPASTVDVLIEYPFPLRRNCVVALRLPADLKASEVERLAAFMRTLMLDPELSNGSS